MKVSVRTFPNVLRNYGEKLDTALDQAVRRTAFKIEGDAKKNTPVDTGALRASIYTVNSKANAFDMASKASATKAAFGGRQSHSVSMLSGRSRIKEAYVVAGAAYAYFVEHGHRTKPFFMAKAAQGNRKFFSEEVAKAIRSVRI